MTVDEFGPGGTWDAMAHVRFLRAAGGASSGYTADLIERLYAAVLWLAQGTNNQAPRRQS
jgi:hypothetical protein